MKLQERKILDDFLAADEPCLGAVFCTYTFDPAYFEDHVLRVLPASMRELTCARG